MSGSEKFWEIADQFMEVIETETGLPVLIYDTDGYIIRATDQTRIGDMHAGARKIMQSLADEYAVTVEEAAQNPLVREGYSCPIIVDGQIVAGFGITGKLDVAKSLARTAARMIDAWIEKLHYQDQLERSEKKYRCLFENSLNGIFQTTIEGQCLTANSEFARILGYDSPDAMIADITDIASQIYVYPEDRSKFLESLFRNEQVSGFVTQLKRHDGQLVDVSIHSRLMRHPDTNEYYIEGHVEDITARKKAEKALRDSESWYRNLFRNNHTIMLIVDPVSADIIDANPAAISFYGWRHAELTCQKITHINVLGEEQVFEEMEQAKTEHRQNFFFKHRLASGDIRDVEVYSGPIKLHGKQLLYSIVHDITERKKAEKERETLILDLRKALSEVKTLRSFLPICSRCKKIRDDKGYWNQIETYIHEHSGTEFSHGICPECMEAMYGEQDWYKKRRDKLS
jgi:PAS domain S-box-containing protein